jgi:hypothetical protein
LLQMHDSALHPSNSHGRDAPHVHVPRESACVPLAWEKQGHGRAALAVAGGGHMMFGCKRLLPVAPPTSCTGLLCSAKHNQTHHDISTKQAQHHAQHHGKYTHHRVWCNIPQGVHCGAQAHNQDRAGRRALDAVLWCGAIDVM